MKVLSVRRLAVLAAALTAGIVMAPVAAHAADYDPPAISTVSASPSTLYLPADGGDSSVTVSVNVSDASGVVAVGARLMSQSNPEYEIGDAPVQLQVGGKEVFAYDGAQLTSGTPEDGTWSIAIPFPPGPSGPWLARVSAVDGVGNVSFNLVRVLTVAQCPCVPTAPGVPIAIIGDPGTVSLSWAPPSVDGGAPVTSYTVTAYPGQKTMTTTSTSATFTGLTPGTYYSFTVAATNSVGTGAASAASTAVLPTAPPVVTLPATVPAAPARPTVKPGKGTLVITWKTPAAHGAAISRYVVAYNGRSRKVPASRHSLTLKHLRRGRYRVSLKAVNSVGVSPASPVVTARVK